jgi:hypothetical protein
MQTNPSQASQLLGSGGFHVEEWESARIISGLPALDGVLANSKESWERIRSFAGSVLSDDDYAARFDPYWHRVMAMVYGANATPESASLATDGARVMVVKLAAQKAANDAIDEADLPPYIPPQTSADPPDIIDTPSQEPRPKGRSLLPILTAVGLSAALVTLHRRSE